MPPARPTACPQPTVALRPGEPQPPGGRLACFLVEDSPLILQNLRATLEELIGAEVIGHAADEDGALTWLKAGPPSCHLMIIDIFLRTGSGLEVLRQARTLLPEARLVVLSNYATPDIRRRCLQLGADRVFDKSAELEELLAYCEQLGERLGEPQADAAGRPKPDGHGAGPRP